MLDGAIDFIYDNSIIIINLSLLLFVALLTFTSKSKDIGVLVCCYCAFYLLMDLSYFGILKNHTILTFDKFAVFYFMCLILTMIVFLWSVYLFFGGNNVAGVYAAWLLIAMGFDGLSSIMQMQETNILLFMYNIIQNISVYVDLFVVFIGMDHIIKRKHNASRIFIECINNTLECWRDMVLLSFSEGAKCSKKN